MAPEIMVEQPSLQEAERLRHHQTTQQQSMQQPIQQPQPQIIKARIVSADQDSLHGCGARLRLGDLVAFPTETVYGLGCNALDPMAICKVFQAKERPLTDPLITHVTENQVAYDLWKHGNNVHSMEGQALRILCQTFWPGPLTLVAQAASHVPSIVMANTGFVACRSPQHPIAISLINAAGVPLAAPSANKFGHVSPTRASHVWDDLKYENVWIIESSTSTSTSARSSNNNEASTTSCSSSGSSSEDDVCQVGVESSVAKVEMQNPYQGTITLLRQGAVCVRDIESCLEQAGLLISTNNPMGAGFVVQAQIKNATKETVAHVAPGQTIRHYSPNIKSYILSHTFFGLDNRSDNHDTEGTTIHNIDAKDKKILSKTVIIDFRGKLKAWKEYALAYKELSGESGNGGPSQATKSVFETLRWAEQVDKAEQIVFPEILENEPGKHDALILALKDRLTRAASGVVIECFHHDHFDNLS